MSEFRIAPKTSLFQILLLASLGSPGCFSSPTISEERPTPVVTGSEQPHSSSLEGSQVAPPAKRSVTRRGEERRKDYDYSRGVDLDFYRLVQGEAACDLKICENSAAERTDTKERAYETAFQRIDQMGRTYILARPFYFNGFNRLIDEQDRTILSQDIVFLKAAEVYDYQHSEYKYTVELGVLKLPRLMPQVESDLQRFLSKVQPRQENGLIVFDLATMLAELKADQEFIANMKDYTGDPAFESGISYKDDDTQRFLKAAQGVEVKIQGYNPGQYAVNSLIGSIIQRTVAPAVMRYLGEYQSLTVLCEGATDALRITKGISYQGAGRAGSYGTTLFFRDTVGQPLSAGIRNNLDLSFARGHEGMQALSQILGPVLKSGRVRLAYTGTGVMALQAGDQPESRRITFKIQLGPKLD